MLNENDPQRSRCICCDTCDGFPCLVQAKSDAEVCALGPALAHRNVELLTEAYVSLLRTSASGREVRRAVVERRGERFELSADIVVVAAGAINSAALLLRHISFVGKLDVHALRAGAPAIAPGWTLELMARHSLDFWLTSEDLPDPDNRVSLDREGRIVLSYTPKNLEGHARLGAQLKELMLHQKCHVHGGSCHEGLFSRNFFVGDRIPLAGVAHQNGTIRFGHDPASSALDTNCRAHDVDNLYVVDGSFFPSSAAVNPALTIMTNALRVGAHLTERLG